ncbi:acpS protein [Pediococcus argentinicus]|uniref:Holo-[acyl-carrier-protein] synthase n=2 Tax=Pediococcus argentinicus TaxID=480391 RepID=A0A0R2NGQ0_9LACO|nr:acpS protein [Pediococcus argentinicus]
MLTTWGDSMIYGIGVDITEIKRVTDIQSRLQLAEKVLTDNELSVWKSYQDKRANEFLAGRFSAKESYSKAYGTGIGKDVGFQDIEILDDDAGKPVVIKHPYRGSAHISISHTDTLVMTEVILEGEQ